MNTKTAKELLAVAQDVLQEIESVRRSKDDDDYDAGWKDGARESLSKLNERIYARIEKLLGKEDSNGSSNNRNGDADRLSGN